MAWGPGVHSTLFLSCIHISVHLKCSCYGTWCMQRVFVCVHLSVQPQTHVAEGIVSSAVYKHAETLTYPVSNIQAHTDLYTHMHC